MTTKEAIEKYIKNDDCKNFIYSFSYRKDGKPKPFLNSKIPDSIFHTYKANPLISIITHILDELSKKGFARKNNQLRKYLSLLSSSIYDASCEYIYEWKHVTEWYKDLENEKYEKFLTDAIKDQFQTQQEDIFNKIKTYDLKSAVFIALKLALRRPGYYQNMAVFIQDNDHFPNDFDDFE